jgi:predicted transglutaminase-like cysteine proteinase
MRRSLPFLVVLSGLVLAAAAHAQKSQQSGKQTYKWVDEKGVTHYGDSVPAEFSQREQRVLNDQGLEIQKRQAEMSQAEAAAAASKQREEAQRKQHDMFLLSTYPSVREIEGVRDVRLDQINGQISASEAYIGSLTTRIDGLKQRSRQFAPYNSAAGARRLPDDLAEEMVRALSELRSQSSALAQRRSELKAINDQFNGDIKRFKELRSAAAARLNEANRPKSDR